MDEFRDEFPMDEYEEVAFSSDNDNRSSGIESDDERVNAAGTPSDFGEGYDSDMFPSPTKYQKSDSSTRRSGGGRRKGSLTTM